MLFSLNSCRHSCTNSNNKRPIQMKSPTSLTTSFVAAIKFLAILGSFRITIDVIYVMYLVIG